MRELIQELVAHCADLRRQLTRELRDPQHAADIAQSSFERVYALALGDGPRASIAAPRALLFRVARNLCIDEARHRQVVQSWAAQHAGSGLQTTAPSCEYVHAQRQVLRRVIGVLESLPPLRREVFLLFRAYGFTRTEIAARLALSEAAVAKHLVRAALDCSRVFAEMQAELIEAPAVSPRSSFRAALAEEGA
ncbi:MULTISPECIES: RNA polymerase sigma factor [unclassified Rhizobacter]|uniref:RNA polymerase sigma factor n=1 Tax=unclassified Rhizobacter TaxID=2640088 RepID=UPI00070009C3|nr:RNA polymerase subunit sigma-24 [Rhizobacter sp. Root29]KQV97949.1 RNA polymerase subunit sigma-24 [Rhizobacter sp. Root1238]KRB18913.1 RNA polymerase subunit sigma-24 [Rhizobacter sp. Root16D2]